MAIKVVKKIPSKEEIEKEMPLRPDDKATILRDRQEVQNILNGQDSRKLLIIGPCSAWPFDATIEYAARLAEIKKNLERKMKVIMRVYTQKPRTTKGWNGPINQPDPYGPPDIPGGIKYTRELMIRIIAMGLPIANEAVFTHDSMKFFPDLLAWMAIGARSTEDQEHRIYASAVDCPVGMKNPTSGSVQIGVNSVIAAQTSQIAVFHGHQIESSGNEYAHLVLRGGSESPNYSAQHILTAIQLMEANAIQNPAVIIDASHDNARIQGKKEAANQTVVIKDVLGEMNDDARIKNAVKGFMVESFLKSGSQTIDSQKLEMVDRGGLSVTDPCLGWEETEDLLMYLTRNL